MVLTTVLALTATCASPTSPPERVPTQALVTATPNYPSASASDRPTLARPSPESSGAEPGVTGANGQDAVTLLAAGDIARCEEQEDEATAALLGRLDGIVLALGDLAYATGSEEDFEQCYAPSWGQHRDRTLPVTGNHDYGEGDADGYLDYFGELAVPDGKTWYSTDLGAWHIIVLNTSCTRAGGCDFGSPQMDWLLKDFAANDARCTLVAMHHPRWSSGWHGDHLKLHSMWRVFYEADVDVVLSAHDHDYERFAPMDPGERVDEDRGIRSFVVGTGGGELRPFAREAPNYEIRNDETFGILRMTLRPERYEWEFVPVEGSDFTDEGSGDCH